MDAAPELLQSYFRRWSNLEEQKAAVAEDLKELFSEAKGNGLDTKVMRAAFRIKTKQDNESDADRELAAMVETYLDALEPSRASRAYAREKIEEFDPATGEVYDGNSEQHIGRADGKQRHAARIQGADGRREGENEGAQGQGAGASGTDLVLRAEPRIVAGGDKHGAGRHVGGEAHHEISEPDDDVFAAVKAQGRLANTIGVEPSPSVTLSLANGPCDAATERSALVGSVTSSAVAGVLGQPETIPALTGQHASANVSGSERAGVTAGETATISEPKLNERCQQPSQCKFSHHPQKITCSACTAAWAVKMKAKVAA